MKKLPAYLTSLDNQMESYVRSPEWLNRRSVQFKARQRREAGSNWYDPPQIAVPAPGQQRDVCSCGRTLLLDEHDLMRSIHEDDCSPVCIVDRGEWKRVHIGSTDIVDCRTPQAVEPPAPEKTRRWNWPFLLYLGALLAVVMGYFWYRMGGV